MKLADILQTQASLIRRESKPDRLGEIRKDGSFYDAETNQPLKLDAADVMADDWQYQKTVWVGGKKKKAEAAT